MKSDQKYPRAGASDSPGRTSLDPASAPGEHPHHEGATAAAFARLERERQAFHIITEAALSNSELTDILKKILEDLLDLLRFDFASLRLYDSHARLLHPTAIAGRQAQTMPDKFPPQSIDDPHYLGAFVARENQPVFAPVLENHPLATSHAMRIQELGLLGVIAHPLVNAGGELIGVVQLHSSASRPGSPGDRTFFETVARMLGTIIEHRRAVDALKESEQGYRSLFENAPAALWVVDFSGIKHYLNQLRAKGVNDLNAHFQAIPGALADCAARIKVLDVNRQALDIFQAPDKQALMSGLAQIVTPQSLQALARELVVIDAGGRGSTTEFENLTLAGEKRQMIMQWFVAPGHESDYGRVFLSFLDVTETQALEAQLLQAQKMESVGTLAGGIAHDFNNIMQAISGYTQLMLWDRGPEDPDYLNLRAIEKAANRASKLTRQLLTFSRKVPSALKPVNLNAEIEAVRAILVRTIPKMIRIECHLDPDVSTINADRPQIEQVLMNIAVNASHAMPDGGRLIYETRNVELDRTFCLAHPEAYEGPHVLLSIADTGHGMDTETRLRVFEPFFTTREIGQGTGLGLAMAYGIVKSHGGYIHCESVPGQGTCFTLYFPALRKVQAQAGNKTDKKGNAPSGSETILVVDDEKVVLDLAETMLKRFGYGVIRAENGEAALAVMAERAGKVDLVILDLNMPGMGGQNCLEALQARFPAVPVLVASGYSPNGSMPDTLASGAAGFIGKPYQLQKMLKTVRHLLDASKIP